MTITRITVIPRDRTLDPTIAQMQREINSFALQVVRLEDQLLEERRAHARTRARLAGAPRKCPAWCLPLAYVGLALGWFWGTYEYETEETDR